MLTLTPSLHALATVRRQRRDALRLARHVRVRPQGVCAPNGNEHWALGLRWPHGQHASVQQGHVIDGSRDKRHELQDGKYPKCGHARARHGRRHRVRALHHLIRGPGRGCTWCWKGQCLRGALVASCTLAAHALHVSAAPLTLVCLHLLCATVPRHPPPALSAPHRTPLTTAPTLPIARWAAIGTTPASGAKM